MKKYVIRLNGFILGGFDASDEDDAFQEMAVLEGYKDFKELLEKRNLKRDNFTVQEAVAEGAP